MPPRRSGSPIRKLNSRGMPRLPLSSADRVVESISVSPANAPK
ncbi:hypothetical protein [Virgisporangium ochraceum]|nr:hypothetical protein [Virgisporangium ochraceum]